MTTLPSDYPQNTFMWGHHYEVSSNSDETFYALDAKLAQQSRPSRHWIYQFFLNCHFFPLCIHNLAQTVRLFAKLSIKAGTLCFDMQVSLYTYSLEMMVQHQSDLRAWNSSNIFGGPSKVACLSCFVRNDGTTSKWSQGMKFFNVQVKANVHRYRWSHTITSMHLYLRSLIITCCLLRACYDLIAQGCLYDDCNWIVLCYPLITSVSCLQIQWLYPHVRQSLQLHYKGCSINTSMNVAVRGYSHI